jgi:hypothetical protein
VDGIDHANADIGIQLIYQFTDDLGRGMQEDLQSGTIIEEARLQQVVGGEGDVEMRDFEEIADDVVNPVVYTDLATRVNWSEEMQLNWYRNSSSHRM